MEVIRLATRGSVLALTQAELVKSRLSALGVKAEIVVIKTHGDKDRVSPLRSIGGSGLFVKEIEQALLDGRADAAVHSGKDLPYVLREGLVIASNPSVEDERDCLVTKKGKAPEGHFVIGTGSERRIEQLSRLYPKAEFKEIRGNADTRIKKLLNGEYDAVCLAMAGIRRLEIKTDDIDIIPLDTADCIPAACQGILAVECRAEDKRTVELLGKITDEEARQRFLLERKLFCQLQADCSMAVAVNARIAEGRVKISALYGKKKAVRECPLGEAEEAIESIVAEFSRGEVYLVGAGSSIGHITARGLKALRRCDCVVYDDLIDPELLYEAPKECSMIYVGKRYEKHSKSQEAINAILVEEAEKGQRVVRLKGGDSFVFGRGGEEVLALQRAGIACEVIPGVCAGISVPEVMGIPVTHRGIAQSVTFITGHTATGRDEDYKALASLKGTLVFFMSLHEAESIAERLISLGKDGDTPVSILQDGYGPDERRIDGRLSDMSALAKKAKTPALIVVGEVAKLHMEATVDRPLRGVSVIATGTEHFSRKLAELLRGKGAHVTRLPVIDICPAAENIPSDFNEYDCLAFTSANGIRVFFEYLKKNRVDLRLLAGVSFACIGSGTRDVLSEYGFNADFVPSEYTAEVMGRELAGVLKEKGSNNRLLILRAENGSRKLNEELDKAGINYRDCHIYRTCRAERAIERPGDMSADYIVFGSAMGVRSFFEKYTLSKGTKAVCIGENTARELEKKGVEALISEKHTAEDIAGLITEDVERRP